MIILYESINALPAAIELKLIHLMGAVMYNNFATVVHLIYIYFEIDIINILDFQNNTILFMKNQTNGV